MTTKTATKTKPVPAVVKAAKARATIPTRPVIDRTKLFRAEMQVELQAHTSALANVDHAITAADCDCDAAIELAQQRRLIIQSELALERDDLVMVIEGINAGLERTAQRDPAPASNVTAITQQAAE